MFQGTCCSPAFIKVAEASVKAKVTLVLKLQRPWTESYPSANEPISITVVKCAF